MRDYGSLANLRRAAVLAAVVTLAGAGRMHAGRLPLATVLPLGYLAMVFVAGAVTAWGTRAGMPGVFTDGRTLRRGAALALGLGLLAAAAQHWGPEPALRQLLDTPRHAPARELAFPSRAAGQVALVLWAAGMQTLILVAAPMSLFARLAGNRWAALALTLALRTYVLHRQLAEAGLADGTAWLYAGAVAGTAAGAVLFATFGLVPAMVFAGAAELHVLLGSPPG